MREYRYKIKFVLSGEPCNGAYLIDENGDTKRITFKEAQALFVSGEATIADIELAKTPDEPKIYTSRFQNPELTSGKYTVVGIVRGLPRFKLGYERAGNIMEIAPPREIFRMTDHEKFVSLYKQHLDIIGVNRIFAILKTYIALGKDVVLCCYEDVRDPAQTCHRIAFAEWWLAHTGQKIEELPNPAPIKYK